MQILTVILLVLVVAWLGRNEIAHSFTGVRVGDILSVKSFLLLLSFSMLAGVAWNLQVGQCLLSLGLWQACAMAMAVCFTVFALSSFRCHSSVVMAFIGAWLGLGHVSGGISFGASVFCAMVSLVAAPLLVLLLSLAFSKWLTAYCNRDIHLLVRNLHIRHMAFVGIVLYSVLLFFNYSWLLDTFLALFVRQPGMPSTLAVPLCVVCCLACLLPSVMVVRKEAVGGRIRQNMSFMYSMAVVFLLSCVLLPIGFGLMPLLLSANQSKEVCSIYFDKPKRNVHVFNVMTITLLTPLLAFLVTVGILVVGDMLVMAFVVLFVALLCFSFNVYTKQYFRSRVLSKTLKMERLHKSEADREKMRLDVEAVTTQFQSISEEIDLKQKELTNIALHIKQERDYMEDMCDRLLRISRLTDLDTMRAELNRQVADLRDNISFNKGKDRFYTEVESIHKHFVSRLMMRCPGLTEGEKRLAIFLRLGFSSKEIAALMNVETKSVEISRYRFRKKLRLDRNVNIVQFLQLL